MGVLTTTRVMKSTTAVAVIGPLLNTCVVARYTTSIYALKYPVSGCSSGHVDLVPTFSTRN
ncbi:hypothetical protein Hanom_Chr09g00775441 [Helianthus anomalus]